MKGIGFDEAPEELATSDVSSGGCAELVRGGGREGAGFMMGTILGTHCGAPRLGTVRSGEWSGLENKTPVVLSAPAAGATICWYCC